MSKLILVLGKIIFVLILITQFVLEVSALILA